MKTINKFEGDYRFLSNFYLSPIFFEGKWYPSVEHAYQAAKTLDAKAREPFQMEAPILRPVISMTAGQAKYAGRKLKIRPDWDKIKVSIMTELVGAKFMKPSLRRHLLSTGDATLIEGNTWGDTFWGVCKGKGLNHLGRILMQLRSRIETVIVLDIDPKV